MKAPLTRTTLALAGIAIADSEGLKALTMRRVASVLDVSGMAAYRHVDDRDDLLVAMVDVITRERRADLAVDSGWDVALRAVAQADWDSFARHPWLIEVWSTPRRRVDMGSFDRLEHLLDQLATAGVPDELCLSIVLGVLGMTLGMAAMAIEDAGATSDPDLSEFWTESARGMGPEFARSHPRSTWFMTHLNDSGGHAAFADALDAFLHGVAARHGLPVTAKA
ncbi:TetR/AcrR family transcriptional regulator [Nocardia cyriacigeorgica]|uniref:TetR/AcrR family transcriptional regulator n=1 Tax=Nocardia cyriacigeorgica TaxID=135487 RepID=A0ABX0CI55_9NOCA|nr:TetR/AcrR family transcriptional regulator [Nocardia cyriacigeorgica]NEW38017.1 TetR/AcrR family transcriptional regulator [Nocardia cyriacigeorgica]NEW56230.1 TetR/AcrR family transcriptional regulator [Nocardia cyriacigeorgica]